MAENRGVSVTDPFSGARAPQPAAIGPTMYDLPSESPEEPGLPDLYHLLQPRLLDETFKPPRIGRDSFFVAADVNLYFDRANPLYHKRPDWYAVLGTTPHYRDGALRLSYVVWDEGVAPLIVIELLSEGTEAEDLGRTQRRVGEPPTKWHVYEQVLRIPYYIVFGREEKVPRFSGSSSNVTVRCFRRLTGSG